MFTGIIEQIGTIKEIYLNGTNRTFWIESSFTNELKIDQSVSHNGVCLTVEAIRDSLYQVTAVDETLQKTNIIHWEIGSPINLERCMPLNGRIDGHLVQGHVDTTASCISIKEKNGSWEYSFEIDVSFSSFIIEKGSIAVNGISLTIFNITRNQFTVAIIPFTYTHTNIHAIIEGEKVNIEFDLIGKYVNRIKNIK